MHLYQSRLKDQIIRSVDGVSVHAEGGVYTDAISGMFNVPFGYSCQPIKQRIAQALDVLPFHPKDHFYSPEWLETGRLLEKYDVTEFRPGGGGEYATQDGFGWTNATYVTLLNTMGSETATK